METEHSTRSRIVGLPHEPPPLHQLLMARMSRGRLGRNTSQALEWIRRKHELPFSKLLWLKSEAYPEQSESELTDNLTSGQQFSRRLQYIRNLMFWRHDLRNPSFQIEALKDQLIENPELVRTADWTAALMATFDEISAAKQFPGFYFASFGDCRRWTDQGEFGVMVYCAKSEEDPWNNEPSLSIGDYKFPIVVRRGSWISDSGSPIHPINGTAACLAVSQRPGLSAREGLLTAGHLLDSPVVGMQIDTTAGMGSVIDVAPPGIDAMLVGVGSSIAITDQPVIPARRLVAAFIPVDFWGRTSGRVPTTITDVTDLFGTLSDRIPGRVFLAEVGQPGDSGALIRDNSGCGIGLYTERFVDEAKREQGMGMHLAQIAHTMKLTLHEF